MLLISFKDLAEKVELKLPLPIICPVFKTWDKSQVYFGKLSYNWPIKIQNITQALTTVS